VPIVIPSNPNPPATAEQIRVYNLHRQICRRLGIPQVQLAHRHLAGTLQAANTQGNVEYDTPGPQVDYERSYTSISMVWLVILSFIRGEQRQDVTAIGAEATPLQQAQLPAVDDNHNLVHVKQSDHVILADGTTWEIDNPVLSPELGFWALVITRVR
jgi:hypothetical protein